MYNTRGARKVVIPSKRHYSGTSLLGQLKLNSLHFRRFPENSRAMSDGEGSAQIAAVETGGQPDNITVVIDGQQQQQQNVSITKDDGEPNPKKAKLSGGGNDVFGRGGGGGDKQHTASEKLEHRLGGILCCAVCLDLPRSSIYQVRISDFISFAYHFDSRPLICFTFYF